MRVIFFVESKSKNALPLRGGPCGESLIKSEEEKKNNTSTVTVCGKGLRREIVNYYLQIFRL